MSLAYDILYAQKCRSTHHKIAMDALLKLRTDDRQRWLDLFLYYIDWYLDGAKAPDTKFKDFRNHVLHVQDNYWGGACKTAQTWYDKTIDLFQRRDWPAAVYSAGVLSHYFTDPFQPFHTGQSEAEGVVHRAEEWSICKSYNDLRRMIETDLGYPEWEIPSGDDWLTQMIRYGAEAGNKHYDICIDHYNIDLGVKNPPAGLDNEIRERIAAQIALSTIGFARVLERIIHDAGATADSVPVLLTLALSTANMPVQAVRDFVDGRAERIRVEEMYAEFKVNGKVVNTLPEDDRAIRKAHATEVLKIPLDKLDSEKPRAPGSKFGSFEPRVSAAAAKAGALALTPRMYNTKGEPINDPSEIVRRLDTPATSTLLASGAARAASVKCTNCNHDVLAAEHAIAAQLVPQFPGRHAAAASSPRRQVMVVGPALAASPAAGRPVAASSLSITPKPRASSLEERPKVFAKDIAATTQVTSSFPASTSAPARGVLAAPSAELRDVLREVPPSTNQVADPLAGMRSSRGSSLLGDNGKSSSGNGSENNERPASALSDAKGTERAPLTSIGNSGSGTSSPRTSEGFNTKALNAEREIPVKTTGREERPTNTENQPTASTLVSRASTQQPVAGPSIRIGGNGNNVGSSSSAAKDYGPSLPLEAVQSEAAREAEALAQMLRASGIAGSGGSGRMSSLLGGNGGKTASSSGTPNGNSNSGTSNRSERESTAARDASREARAERDAQEPREARSSSGNRSRSLKHYLNLDDDLEAAPSIGRKSAIRFAKIGIHTVRDFLKANPEEMADKIDQNHMSAKLIREWQLQAKLNTAIPNLRGHDAQILVGCGIREASEVATATVDVLWDFVNEYVKTSEGQRVLRGSSLPDANEVKEWIEWAQDARPIVL